MKRHLSLLLGGPSLFVMATAAVAQPDSASPVAPVTAQDLDDAAAEEGDDDAIIILARRRAENRMVVPQAVQAVTGQNLAEYNLFTFEDIEQLVPGLTITAPASGVGTSASTRGATFNINTQSSPTMEVYFNEIPVQPALMFQNQFDVGQIEVLKGPQGTVRGKSSPSGSMTLTTRRPDLNEIGGSVSLTGTSRGGINMQAALGVPIIQDVLAIRLAGTVDHNRNGGVRSINSEEDPYTRTYAFRGTVRFEPTENISLVLMYQRLKRTSASFGQALHGAGVTTGVNIPAAPGPLFRDFSGGFLPCNLATAGTGFCAISPGGVPAIFSANGFNGGTIGPEDYRAVADFLGFDRNAYHIATAQLDWSFAGQKLSYVGGYNEIDFDSRGGGGDGTNTIIGVQSGLTDVANHSIGHTWTHELRLASEERLGGIFDYTVGGFYQRETGQSNSPTAFTFSGAWGSPLGASAPTGPGLIQPTTFDSRYGLDWNREGYRIITEKSINANLVGHFFDDRLELEAGGRQIWLKTDRMQLNTFVRDPDDPLSMGGRGLIAMRNPNNLGPCPGTITGVTDQGIPFFSAAVVGTTYPGTCDVQLTLNNGFVKFLPDTASVRHFKKFVFRLSASFKVTPDHMVYGTYGTAFRGGPGPITGAPACSAASITDPDFPAASRTICTQYFELDPDENKGFEFGYKGQFFDRRLNVTVAVYKQKFSNFFSFGSGITLGGASCLYPHIIGTTVQPNGCSVTNAVIPSYGAPINTKGIDADFNFRVSDNLRFGAGASWTRGRFAAGASVPCSDRNFDGIPDGPLPPGFNATTYLNSSGAVGTNAPDSAYGIATCDPANIPALKPNANPDWNFNANAEYSHGLFPNGRGFIRGLFNYTPKNKNLDPVTTFVPKAYGILNLFAGVRAEDGSWEVSVAARNVLNNKTITQSSLAVLQLTRPTGALSPATPLSFSGLAGNSAGYNSIGYVERREFQLTARFAFGPR